MEEERFSAVLKIIEDADADFVCLHEVTDESKEFFLQSDYINSLLA